MGGIVYLPLKNGLYLEGVADNSNSMEMNDLILSRFLVSIGIVILILFHISCTSKKQKNTNESDLSTISFLTQKTQQSEYLEALISSKPEEIIVDENGCLRIKDYLIIWPFGFKVIPKNNKWTIVDNQGNFVVNIGDKVIVSGGECAKCSNDQIEKITGTKLNKKCKGIYWIVGNDINRKKTGYY